MPFLQYTLTLISECSWILLTLIILKSNLLSEKKRETSQDKESTVRVKRHLVVSTENIYTNYNLISEK